MRVYELKLHSHEEGRQARREAKESLRPEFLRRCGVRWLTAVLVASAVVVLQAPLARAQATSTPVNPCPTQLMPGQNLIRVPEIVSNGGKLRGTIILGSEQQWMTFRVPVSAPSDSSRSQCLPQYVRTFRELGAVSTLAPTPAGSTVPKGSYALPRPGPTLRARVGDLVQLTLINQVDPGPFGDSIDRDEQGRGGGCDEGGGYPAKVGDRSPDCFHGSSTGNLHFHGTHTNPGSTGDNVFLEIRPSVRDRVTNKPLVTPESVEKPFNEFYAACEAQLSTTFFSSNALKQWPKTWSDLPKSWTDEQKWLIKLYDTLLENTYGPGVKKLWPVNEKQLLQGAWPQYYVGAYPYCFRLPKYTETPPASHSGAHAGAGTAEQEDSGRTLMMGQAPGTHWYHAHKHGSTALNVANGMTGAFIIEGQYDDDLNTWYGANWTRTQPVLVINQLGVTPNLMRGGAGQQDKGPDFSVNGQIKPTITMKPGEVQMWRIVNTAGRAGTLFLGPPNGFQWKQLAQDGVQFNVANYGDPDKDANNKSFLLAAGNRADLLVKAPTSGCAKPGDCPVKVKNIVDPQDISSANELTLLSVVVSGTPVASTSNGAKFIPKDKFPTFPPFLADITDAEVKGTKKMVFSSTPPKDKAMHMIDGKKFDGEVGAVVLLNTVEEWKVVNETYGPPISHPFHIHINPFQVVEVFDPNANVTDSNGKPVNGADGKPLPKYVFDKKDLDSTQLDPQDPTKTKSKTQCLLDLNDSTTWKDCLLPSSNKNLVWWDVFPIPSGRVVGTVKLPGYFRMRSRFVDYSGYYVLHCHILAHEDRGMMTVVEVAPARSPYSHH